MVFILYRTSNTRLNPPTNIPCNKIVVLTGGGEIGYSFVWITLQSTWDDSRYTWSEPYQPQQHRQGGAKPKPNASPNAPAGLLLFHARLQGAYKHSQLVSCIQAELATQLAHASREA